jgi:type II secretory pathway pseudopilin PulG
MNTRRLDVAQPPSAVLRLQPQSEFELKLEHSRGGCATSFSSRRRRSRRRVAFTAVELLVVIVILVILASIFVPYGLKVRETSRRAQCRDNLRQIFQALQSYAGANGSYFPRVVHDPAVAGYTAFTGADDPNPFAANSSVQPNDVTASLWLLVRGGYITDPRVFVCPSTDDVPDARDGMRERSNFHSPRNLSYSYACPFSPVPGYKLTDTMKWDFVVLADANPGGPSGAARPPFGASQAELATINSANHGTAGQNVVYAPGVVEFQWNPYCATDNDDIYTAQIAAPAPGAAPTTTPTTTPTTVPAKSPGLLGRHAFPVSPIDSFVVPARDEQVPAGPTRAPSTATTVTPPPATATAPVTAPATVPATSPLPATVPAAATQPSSRPG